MTALAALTVASRPRPDEPRPRDAAWYAQFNRRARLARQLRNNAAPRRAA